MSQMSGPAPANKFYPQPQVFSHGNGSHIDQIQRAGELLLQQQQMFQQLAAQQYQLQWLQQQRETDFRTQMALLTTNSSEIGNSDGGLSRVPPTALQFRQSVQPNGSGQLTSDSPVQRGRRGDADLDTDARREVQQLHPAQDQRRRQRQLDGPSSKPDHRLDNHVRFQVDEDDMFVPTDVAANGGSRHGSQWESLPVLDGSPARESKPPMRTRHDEQPKSEVEPQLAVATNETTARRQQIRHRPVRRQAKTEFELETITVRLSGIRHESDRNILHVDWNKWRWLTLWRKKWSKVREAKIMNRLQATVIVNDILLRKSYFQGWEEWIKNKRLERARLWATHPPPLKVLRQNEYHRKLVKRSQLIEMARQCQEEEGSQLVIQCPSCNCQFTFETALTRTWCDECGEILLGKADELMYNVAIIGRHNALTPSLTHHIAVIQAYLRSASSARSIVRLANFRGSTTFYTSSSTFTRFAVAAICIVASFRLRRRWIKERVDHDLQKMLEIDALGENGTVTGRKCFCPRCYPIVTEMRLFEQSHSRHGQGYKKRIRHNAAYKASIQRYLSILCSDECRQLALREVELIAQSQSLPISVAFFSIYFAVKIRPKHTLHWLFADKTESVRKPLGTGALHFAEKRCQWRQCERCGPIFSFFFIYWSHSRLQQFQEAPLQEEANSPQAVTTATRPSIWWNPNFEENLNEVNFHRWSRLLCDSCTNENKLRVAENCVQQYFVKIRRVVLRVSYLRYIRGVMEPWCQRRYLELRQDRMKAAMRARERKTDNAEKRRSGAVMMTDWKGEYCAIKDPRTWCYRCQCFVEQHETLMKQLSAILPKEDTPRRRHEKYNGSGIANTQLQPHKWAKADSYYGIEQFAKRWLRGASVRNNSEGNRTRRDTQESHEELDSQSEVSQQQEQESVEASSPQRQTPTQPTSTAFFNLHTDLLGIEDFDSMTKEQLMDLLEQVPHSALCAEVAELEMKRTSLKRKLSIFVYCSLFLSKGLYRVRRFLIEKHRFEEEERQKAEEAKKEQAAEEAKRAEEAALPPKDGFKKRKK